MIINVPQTKISKKIDDNKLHLNVSGEEAILYPFFKFLEVPEELKEVISIYMG